MHDPLGDAPGKIVLEEIQALLEHVAVVLPADQAGHAGVDGLMHQQVMQAVEERAQQQGDHGHPDQLGAVDLEEVRRRRALGQVDDAAQVAEQRDFDQGADQSHYQERGEARPHLAQVIEIEGQDFSGGPRWGRRGKYRSAVQNDDRALGLTPAGRALLSKVHGAVRAPRKAACRPQSMRLADLMITGSIGTFCMPCLVVVWELTMMSTTSMPLTTLANTA